MNAFAEALKGLLKLEWLFVWKKMERFKIYQQ